MYFIYDNLRIYSNYNSKKYLLFYFYIDNYFLLKFFVYSIL